LVRLIIYFFPSFFPVSKVNLVSIRCNISLGNMLLSLIVHIDKRTWSLSLILKIINHPYVEIVTYFRDTHYVTYVTQRKFRFLFSVHRRRNPLAKNMVPSGKPNPELSSLLYVLWMCLLQKIKMTKWWCGRLNGILLSQITRNAPPFWVRTNGFLMCNESQLLK
jgi:hypothetical protein